MSNLKNKKQNKTKSKMMINHSNLENNLSSNDEYWKSTVFGFKCIFFLLIIVLIILIKLCIK